MLSEPPVDARPRPSQRRVNAESLPRRAMIDNQLRPNGVNEPALLRAIAVVDRMRFTELVDPALAYGDRPIALGGGRALNPVLTTARLLLDLAVRPGQRVLLVGAATGYAAALLSALGAEVAALETDENLIARARELLADDPRVTLFTGALADGATSAAPFDAMLIDGAIETLPPALSAQVRPGGRLATGVNDRGVTRLARGVRVAAQDAVQLVDFADLECVRLPGFSPPPRFRF